MLFKRSIYVARGLRKEPHLYMKSPLGVAYPPKAEALRPVHEFLGEFKLADNVVLQAVTHKSFAHGKTPYNERLAILGKAFVQREVARAIAEAEMDVKVNALDVTTSSQIVSQISKKNNLNSVLFWKPANDSPKTEATVNSSVVHALVGAVLHEHGDQKAQEFVSERLLQGDSSLYELASQLYKA